MDKVRIGVIGTGSMGKSHARYIKAGEAGRCELTALCDADPGMLDGFADIKCFTDYREMIASDSVDAVLIATPHYQHTLIGIAALEHGLHVLMEKPISAHKADAQRLLDAHTNQKQIFAAMFQMRTRTLFRKIKSLLDRGELGRLVRISWTITDWYRSHAYYASGGWRATWAGEGGGVLLNQCPHQLDLMQWFFGMPSRIRAFCRFGVYHDIEVEDDVTAYLEYPNGATGVFVTSTGEAPGTDRLEIAGEMGKLLVESGRIHFMRNECSMAEFSRATDQHFAKPEVWNIEVPIGADKGNSHALITRNFVDAIIDGGELIAPAAEGINSLELANAMLYSSITGTTVELPLDGSAYEAELRRLIAASSGKG